MPKMVVEDYGTGLRRRWFRKDKSDEIRDEALKIANAAKDESERLVKTVSESLKGVDVGSELQRPYSGLISQLHRYADPQNITNVAARTLDEALKAQFDWEVQHSRGFRKVGSTVQHFANSLANFVGAYSGVVDVVKRVGGPYGEAGYQAISVLLFVAVNKSSNDDFITDELENLVDCFPRINLIAQLYPDEKIERRVLEVYSGVIYFARDATTYFLSTSKRIFKSLQPQEAAVQKQINSIKRSLAELNAWSMVFMQKETQKLAEGNRQLLEDNHQFREDNRKLREEIAELKFKLNGMEARDLQRSRQEESDAIEAVRLALGQPDQKLGSNINLKECLRSQSMAFPSTNHHAKSSAKYSQMSLTFLEKQESYRHWASNSHGCLLVLGGRTKPEGQLQRSGYSWLSPAATDTCVRLQRKNERIGFFSCHPQSWLVDEEVPTMPDLVAGLLFQILKYEPAILKDGSQRQRANLDVKTWSGKKDKEILDNVKRSVVDWFRKVSKSQWVYLIVDRAERCRGRLKLLLRFFRDLVMDPECKIKALLVYDAVESDMLELDWEHFLEDSQGFVYHKIEWNQEKMGTEKSPLREPAALEP